MAKARGSAANKKPDRVVKEVQRDLLAAVQQVSAVLEALKQQLKDTVDRLHEQLMILDACRGRLESPRDLARLLDDDLKSLLQYLDQTRNELSRQTNPEVRVDLRKQINAEAADIADLRKFQRLLRTGNTREAYAFIQSCDTAVREYIPDRIWQHLHAH